MSSSTPASSSTSPSPPPNKKNKSFRSRVGTVMRRSSTFSLGGGSRTSTPSNEGDTSSLKQLDTAALAPPAASAVTIHAVPSPIAESPAREAAALAPEPKGPSPLARSSTTAPSETSVQPAPSNDPPKISEPAPESSSKLPEINEIPPTPSNIFDKSGPSVLTSEPEEIDSSDDRPQPRSQPETRGNNKNAPETAQPDAWNENRPAEPLTDTSARGGPTTYFDMLASKAAPSNAQSPPVQGASSQTTPRAVPVQDTRKAPSVATNDSKGSLIPRPVQSQPQPQPQTPPQPRAQTPEPALIANPWASRVGNLSAKPSQSSFASSAVSSRDQPRYAAQFIYGSNHGHGDVSYSTSKATSKESSLHEDPFADPPRQATVGQAAPSTEPTRMPEPEPSRVRDFHYEEREHEQAPPVTMPLPEIPDVIPSRSQTRDEPSYLFGDRSKQKPVDPEPYMDERRPLLPRSQSSPGRGVAVSYLQPTPLLHTLGWIEYVLPDSSYYYVHPTMRVITDADLRTPNKLHAVTAYLDGKGGGSTLPPPGWELWLRDMGATSNEFRPVRGWVDHKNRIVSFDMPEVIEQRRENEEDRMDMEYRYWTFMESHPAHVALPPNARAEAWDALTWSYTDRLLPSSRPIPPPFSQEECQELTGLLRSSGDSSTGDSSIQAVVQTRIVARILLRMTQWRQTYYRPHKPLPRDAAKGGPNRPAPQRKPFRWALFEFIFSVLCLGIPHIFAGRPHHIDEEGGIQRHSTGPMLAVGACACLIAAIILSASVTFISLPGIDSVARVAGFVAVLCSAASMVSAAVALLRYKMDVDRTVPIFGGGEGMISRRSMLMSLPLVFLSYSVIAFLVGIVTYSFNGVTVTDIGTISHHFSHSTGWSVVGTIGGLTCVLIIAVLAVRR